EIREMERASWSSRPHSVEDALKQIPKPHTPGNIFRWVRDHIDFEPYTGALRGATGTLAAGSGNAVDQALLLTALFNEAGHETRFVTGTIHPQDAVELMRKFAGSASVVNTNNLAAGGIFGKEDAAGNTRYLQLIQQHVWVEVNDQDTMRAADPILAPLFGMSPAVSNLRSETLPEMFATSLEIQLVGNLKDGQETTHLTVAGPLSLYAYRALTLGFSDEPSRQGSLRPTFTLDGRSTHGLPVPVSQLVNLELRYTLSIGRRQSKWTQTLFRQGTSANIFAFDQQHFSIAVIPGWTSNDQVARLGTKASNDAVSKIDAWIDARGKSKRPATKTEIHQTVQGVLDDLGPLLPFAFARNLDRITFELADNLGVRPILQSPRIVTTAILRQADRYHVDVELQGDVIEAMPMQGVPSVVATGFLGLYGRIKNQLEGDLLEEATTRKAVTVNVIFEAAQKARIPFTTIESSSIKALESLEVDPSLKARMRDMATRRGMVLLAPTKMVTIDGVEHYGWWGLHPLNGVIEGYSHDALLSQRAESVTVTPADSVLDTIRGTLRISALLYRSISLATEGTTHYSGAVCAARGDLISLSRAMCATNKPLDLPKLSSCLEEKPTKSQGIVSFTAPTCTSQIARSQCGAVVINAFLRGRLSVLNPIQVAELKEEAEAGETVTSPRPPVCR
ncbi:MAG: transglutaminase-like domain-containing protein, partial [Bradymonadaceae bacterium]